MFLIKYGCEVQVCMYNTYDFSKYTFLFQTGESFNLHKKYFVKYGYNISQVTNSRKMYCLTELIFGLLGDIII